MGKKIRRHHETNSGHGRIEERSIEALNACHAGISWPGLMQFGRITRIRTIKKSGRSTTEVAYFITSLPESSTTAAELLALNRGHWSIENKLFWVKDNVFMEDRSTVRRKNAPEVLVALRNAALLLLKTINNSPTIAREICSMQPNIAITQCIT